jgi:hypothetical protein
VRGYRLLAGEGISFSCEDKPETQVPGVSATNATARPMLQQVKSLIDLALRSNPE